MKDRSILLVFLVCISMSAGAQQSYSGGNSCVIRIMTNMKEYQFGTSGMSARLNDAMDRFEFVISVSDLRSLGDASDINFLERFTGGSDPIILNAALPDDKDGQLNLSYFKGNKSLELAGELKIGSFVFKNDVNFKGMFIGSNQRMAFDARIFVNTSVMTLPKVNDERIIEIELDAGGDKIVGLTSNQWSLN